MNVTERSYQYTVGTSTPVATISTTGRISRMFFSESKAEKCSSSPHSSDDSKPRKWSIRKKVPYSESTMRTMLKHERVIDPYSTPGKTYFLSLKVDTKSKIAPEAFKLAVKKMTEWLTRNNAQWLYAMEWHPHEASPHVHFLINSIGSNFQHKVVKKWLAVIPLSFDIKDKQDCLCLDTQEDMSRVKSYIHKLKTKGSGFNKKAKESGGDWSNISPYGCSHDWRKHKENRLTVSIDEGYATRRTFVNLQCSRGIAANKVLCRYKNVSPERKRRYSSVQSFSAENISEEEARRIIGNAREKVEATQRETLKDLRQLWSEAVTVGCEDVKAKIRQSVFDEFDFEPDESWNLPPQSRCKIHNSGLMRLLRRAKVMSVRARNQERRLPCYWHTAIT